VLLSASTLGVLVKILSFVWLSTVALEKFWVSKENANDKIRRDIPIAIILFSVFCTSF